MTARQFAALWERRKLHAQSLSFTGAHIAAMYHAAHFEKPHPEIAEFMPYYEPPVISGQDMVQKFLALGAKKIEANE